MSERTYRALLVLITIAALGLRIGLLEKFVGFSSPIDPADGLDESDYELFAYQMSTGRGYVLEDGTPSARRAPGTSLCLLPVYLVLGRSLAAARLWIVVLSAANCAAAAWVVRRRCGERAALATAAALAVDPGMFYYALHLWSEAPYCLAITLTIGCALRAVETRFPLWSAAAGLGWGAALLLRPQTVLVAPCAAVGLLWLKPEARQGWLAELVRQGVVAVVIVSPWLIRNHLVMGAPTMATLVGGHTFWGAHNAKTFHEERYRGLWIPHVDDSTMTYPLSGSEREQDRQAWDNGWRSIRRNLAELPRLLAWKVYRLVAPFEETTNRAVYWSFAVSWIAAAPLAAFGLVRLKRLDAELLWWIAVLIASTLMTTLIFYGAARFRHALEPFLMMGVGAVLAPRSAAVEPSAA